MAEFDLASERIAPPSADPANAPTLQSTRQPDATQDPYALSDQQLLELYEETRKLCEPGREAFEAIWWRNLLYVLGRQWIYYAAQSKTWNDKRMAKWIPKPVTNKIAEGIQALRAMLASIKPSIVSAPIGKSARNQMAAQTADETIPLLHKEHRMNKQMRIADSWVLTTGNVFLNPHWNPEDRVRTAPVVTYVCRTCGATPTAKEIVDAKQRCPVCRGINLAQDHVEQRPLGSGRTLVASPFEVLIPMYAQDFDQVDRLIYLTWRPKHQIIDEYGEEMLNANKIAWEKSPQQTSLQMFRALATQIDFQLSPEAYSTAVMSGEIDGTTEAHLWIKPCNRFPEGLYCRFLHNGKIVARPINVDGTPSDLKLPTKTIRGKRLWPWIHYGYEPVDGRLYHRSALEPAIQKQDQINRGDSSTELTMMRMANPVWMEPKGAEVERLTGEPGLIVRWQPTGANGAKPERVEGVGPVAASFTLRAQHVQDLEEAMGSYDVLKGTKPAGVEAYSALQLLVERSQSRFANAFANRAEAYRQWAELAIELERVYGPTERVKSTRGPNRSWTFETFMKAQLDGDFEITVDEGTTTPKTSLGKRAALEHGKQLGIVNPQDPDQQYSMLQDLGLMHLSPSLDADVQAALEEQEAFEAWVSSGMPGGPAANPLKRLPFIQNDRVHFTENRKWANSDRVREMLMDQQFGQIVLQLITLHLKEHYQGAMQQAAAESGTGSMDNSRPGGADRGNGRDNRGVGAGRAAANSNQENIGVGAGTRV